MTTSSGEWPSHLHSGHSRPPLVSRAFTLVSSDAVAIANLLLSLVREPAREPLFGSRGPLSPYCASPALWTGGGCLRAGWRRPPDRSPGARLPPLSRPL